MKEPCHKLWKRKRTKLSAAAIRMPWIPRLISIVLPVYNGEDYLAEAIESVLAQTWQNWELLVVDDGSVDESAEIAERYAKKDPRIQVIRQDNQKLPRALNRGFQQAKGEFYTWLSADNRMLPHCLTCLVTELLDGSEIDMVYGNMTLIDRDGKPLVGHGWFEFPPKSGRVMLPSSTACLNYIPNNTIGAAFLYRAGCEAVLGGYSPLQYLLEDYDYFMRLNSLFTIRHSRECMPLYEYRMHPNSLTAHDEELGITATRPKLMAFDGERRRAYGEKVGVCLEEGQAALWTACKKAGLKRIAHATKRKPRFSFCVIGEEDKIQPMSMPVYRLKPTEDGGYMVLSVEYPADWTCYDCGGNLPWCFSNATALVQFLKMGTISHWLKQEEWKVFGG